MAYIGLANLHYAKMTTEDTATTAPVYGTPKRLVGVNSVTVTPETETATLYGDNQALDTRKSRKETGISLEIAKLPLEDQAEILGHSYNSDTKTMAVNGDDTAPNVAIMYDIDREDGTKEYHVFYKGKFEEPEQETNTRGESLEFELHHLDGTFVARTDNNAIEKVIIAAASDTTTAASWYASVGGGA